MDIFELPPPEGTPSAKTDETPKAVKNMIKITMQLNNFTAPYPQQSCSEEVKSLDRTSSVDVLPGSPGAG